MSATDHPETSVSRAALAIGSRLARRPEVLLTLGSGLAGVADGITDPVDIPLGGIPGVPPAMVDGHPGLLRAGELAGRPVLAQLGRSHLYEGHPPAAVVRVVEAAAELGCTTFVATNAAGGLREDMRPGDLVAITDHLNLTGVSPLLGRQPLPFIDLGDAYDPELRSLATEVAREHGVDLAGAVYAGVLGPTYETPAEARMLRTLGADIVGMSTVSEVIAARARGLRVVALSVVTNVHGRGHISHEEVLDVSRAAGATLAVLVRDLIGRLPV